MALAEVLSGASQRNSPLGPIPAEFTRLESLCLEAHMAYTDMQIKAIDGSAIPYRVWKIVADREPLRDSRGNTRGVGLLGHHKFCMLLTLIEHLHPDWTRASVLNEAVDRKDPEIKKLYAKPWKEMHNAMANMAIRGYEILKSKRALACGADVDFDDLPDNKQLPF